MSMEVFLNEALQELTNCLLWFIQIKMKMLTDLKPEYIPYQKV